MDQHSQLAELEKLAGLLGVDVSYEPMQGLVQGIGGLCRVQGRYRIIIDRRFKTSERVSILLDALRRFDTQQVYVTPQLRRLLAQGPESKPEPRRKTATVTRPLPARGAAHPPSTAI